MKRFVAVLLTIVMMTGILPITAMAEDEFITEEIDASAFVLQAGGLYPSLKGESEAPLLRGSSGQPLLRGTVDEETLAAVKQTIYNGLRAHWEIINLSQFNMPYVQSEFVALYADVLNEHPELYYCSFKNKVIYTGAGNIYSVTPEYYDYGQEESERFAAATNAVLSQMDSNWSELQKALFLHDYLVTHCEYDLSNPGQSAYDALVRRRAVCQGYALAYSFLGKLAGLNVRMVTSETLDHAWNMVGIDGQYYFIDCTWDDSIGWYEAYCPHQYCICSKDAFGHDIVVKTGEPVTDWVSGSIDALIGIETSTLYDNAWWNDAITAIAQVGTTGVFCHRTLDNHRMRSLCLRNIKSGIEYTLNVNYPDIWPVWNEADKQYIYSFSSFAALNGVIYYTMPTKIYRLNNDGSSTLVYSLTAAEQEAGYLYGLVNDGGRLYYNLGTAPLGVEFVRKEFNLGTPIATEILMSASRFNGYSDREIIGQQEAVWLLTDIGIFNSTAGEAFCPFENLTRAEAAILVTRMCGAVPAGRSDFVDMTGFEWAEPYVKYAVEAGLMTGYDSARFGPGDSITYAEFSRILLCLLGYGPVMEGFSGGTDWEIKVITLSNAIGGLHFGLDDFDWTSPIPREAAAQMAYNALRSTVVEYAGETASPKANVAYDYRIVSDGVRGGDSLMQLIEQSFPFVKLYESAVTGGTYRRWFPARSAADYAYNNNCIAYAYNGTENALFLEIENGTMGNNAGETWDACRVILFCSPGSTAYASGAFYDEDGRFIEVYNISENPALPGVNVNYWARNDASSARFFLLNQDCAPLCAKVETSWAE